MRTHFAGIEDTTSQWYHILNANGAGEHVTDVHMDASRGARASLHSSPPRASALPQESGEMHMPAWDHSVSLPGISTRLISSSLPAHFPSLSGTPVAPATAPVTTPEGKRNSESSAPREYGEVGGTPIEFRPPSPVSGSKRSRDKLADKQTHAGRRVQAHTQIYHSRHDSPASSFGPAFSSPVPSFPASLESSGTLRLVPNLRAPSPLTRFIEGTSNGKEWEFRLKSSCGRPLTDLFTKVQSHARWQSLLQPSNTLCLLLSDDIPVTWHVYAVGEGVSQVNGMLFSPEALPSSLLSSSLLSSPAICPSQSLPSITVKLPPHLVRRGSPTCVQALFVPQLPVDALFRAVNVFYDLVPTASIYTQPHTTMLTAAEQGIMDVLQTLATQLHMPLTDDVVSLLRATARGAVGAVTERREEERRAEELKDEEERRREEERRGEERETEALMPKHMSPIQLTAFPSSRRGTVSSADRVGAPEVSAPLEILADVSSRHSFSSSGSPARQGQRVRKRIQPVLVSQAT
jgi:hypothetical protein